MDNSASVRVVPISQSMSVPIVGHARRNSRWIRLLFVLTVGTFGARPMAQDLTSSPLVEQLIQDQIQQEGGSPSAPAPTTPKDRPFWKNPLTMSMMAADLGDNVSTITGKPVYTSMGNLIGKTREANPLLPQNHIANAAMQGGLSVAKAALINKLSRTHPNLAKVLAGVDIGVGTFDTASNLRVAGGGRPFGIFQSEARLK